METFSMSTGARAAALALGAVLFWAFGMHAGLIFGNAPAGFSWGVTGMTLAAVLNLLLKLFKGRMQTRPRKMTPQQKKWADERQQTSVAVGICHYASLIIEDGENVLVPLRQRAVASDTEAATRLREAETTLEAMEAAVTAFNAQAGSLDKTGVLNHAKPVDKALGDWRTHRAFLIGRGHQFGPSSSFWN